MKKKIILLLSCILLLSGCGKYNGSWCKYTEVFSILIVTKNNVTEEEISNIENVIKGIEDVKNYDIVRDIDNGNPTINIYFNSKEDMSYSEMLLSNLDGVDKIELNSFEVVEESLTIKHNSKYTYGKYLNSVDAIMYDGKLSIDNNTLYLKDNNINFYYKDKYLCSDKECSSIFKKSNTNSCS